MFDILRTLLPGVVVTLEVTVLASVLATVVALIAGTARLSRLWIVRTLAGTYIEVFRGTSAIVQLYYAFFVLPLLGLSLTPLTAGVLALGLNLGSYGAEVVRGGVQAVPQAQREAAIALGMSRWAQFRRVVLPQALVVILPSAGNLYIDLLKLSSLVSLINLADITFRGQALRLTSGETFAIFTVMLVLYFILASIIAMVVRMAERRARRGIDAGVARRGIIVRVVNALKARTRRGIDAGVAPGGN
jgi:polar amino acid transport system permease protein